VKLVRWILCHCLLGLWPALCGASLTISLREPPFEGAQLSQERIFARIDSLESQYGETEGSERAKLARRLGELYLSLQMFKHRRLALEYLDEAIELEPENFDAARVRAGAALTMRYERDARQGFERMVRAHGRDARPSWLLGRYHFQRARRVFAARDFERARSAFLLAVQLDPRFADAWHGLAAAQLALLQWDAVLASAKKLIELSPQNPAGDYLAGAAYSALGDQELSTEHFTRALSASDAATAAIFERGEGLLDEHALLENIHVAVNPQLLRIRMKERDPDWEFGDKLDPRDARHLLRDESIRAAAVADFWRERNVWPSHVVNSRLLTFWRRLVEADVLLGDVESGERGWQTPPGQAIARWGRPDRVHFEPFSFHAHASVWYDQGVRLSPAEEIPTKQQLLVFTYHRDGNWFSLLFTDGSHNFRWVPASATAEEIVSRSRQQPMLFFDGEAAPRFAFDFAHVSYPRGALTRLETTLAITTDERFVAAPRLIPLDPAERSAPSLLTVEWALFDAADRRIEYVRRELDASSLRSRLLRASGIEPTGDVDPLLCEINAALAPGDYRLAIDISSPHLGHRSRQMEIQVPDSDPPGYLSLSDLRLAEAFAPYRPEGGLPAEFVRYAYGIVPLPSRCFAAASQQGFVYFEVYNLATDEVGQTRFNVSYEIFRVRDTRTLPSSGEMLDRSQLAEFEPIGATFVEERTGQAPEGHVVKGSALDLARLGEGEFVLVVGIEDLLARQKTSRFVRFARM
jgi:GWxTD domain-containing protein